MCESEREEGGGVGGAHLFLPSLLDQGHFSLGISTGQLHQQRGEEGAGERGENDGSDREREAVKTVAVFRVCGAWRD